MQASHAYSKLVRIFWLISLIVQYEYVSREQTIFFTLEHADSTWEMSVIVEVKNYPNSLYGTLFICDVAFNLSLSSVIHFGELGWTSYPLVSRFDMIGLVTLLLSLRALKLFAALLVVVEEETVV